MANHTQLTLSECDRIISTARNTIQSVVTSLSLDNTQYAAHKRRLESCLRNIERIRNFVDGQSFHEMKSSMQNLIQHVSIMDVRADLNHQEHEEPRTERAVFSAKRIPPEKGSKGGRPKVDVSKEQLEFMLREGFTCKKMAEHLSCSSSYVYKQLASHNLQARKKYSSINDEELNLQVAKLHADFPNAGQQMMAAYLKANGIIVQRSRVRASLSQVDPPSVARRWSNTVQRRTYKVPTPNSLWHMDGHMKLVRWKLVTHGCIDGYSRCVTYLHCGQDNSTLTVLKLFVGATLKYGLPSRTRSDHGGENYFVALFMELVQGRNRASHITGESKHNERIERLWKDVFLQVISFFYELFYSLEDRDLLDVSNPLHLIALHRVYLPEINRRLGMFQEAWNRHSIRTAAHCSPHQMWVSGMLNSSSNYTSVDHVFSTRDVASDLRHSLSYYGLAPDALGEVEELATTPMSDEVLSPQIGLSSERIDELAAESMSASSDMNERYRLLQEMLHTELNLN